MLRFTGTERALHWGFAAGYLALLASGLPLLVPSLRAWIRGYHPVIGLRLHLASAVLWVGLTVAVVALGDRRRLGQTWREMVTLGREDWAWLARFPRWLVARTRERARLDAAVGRFNGGQKVNVIFTVLTSALLLLTGAAVWPLDATGSTLAGLVTGGGSVAYWTATHRWLTLIALGPLAGHLFMALGHPATRPALTAMLGGQIDRAWAATHHPRWRDGG
jgi:formate dehydrogenase subunit gamma